MLLPILACAVDTQPAGQLDPGHALILGLAPWISGLVAAAMGFATIFTGQRIKAAELLLGLERHFHSVHKTCLDLDTPSTYDSTYRSALTKAVKREPLTEAESGAIMQVDECLRFFTFCRCLRNQLWLGRRAFYEAYQYHLETLLNDRSCRELASYVEMFYPKLWKWISEDERPGCAYILSPRHRRR